MNSIFLQFFFRHLYVKINPIFLVSFVIMNITVIIWLYFVNFMKYFNKMIYVLQGIYIAV